jgi:hypothetical protein
MDTWPVLSRWRAVTAAQGIYDRPTGYASGCPRATADVEPNTFACRDS